MTRQLQCFGGHTARDNITGRLSCYFNSRHAVSSCRPTGGARGIDVVSGRWTWPLSHNVGLNSAWRIFARSRSGL